MGSLCNPGPLGPIGIITLSQIRCPKPLVFGTFLERGSLYVYYNMTFYFVLIYREVYFKNIPKKPVFRHLYKMGRPPIDMSVIISSTQDSRFAKPRTFCSIPAVSEATGISLRAVRSAYHSGRTSIKKASGESLYSKMDGTSDSHRY